MPWVQPHGIPEAGHGFVKLLKRQILMARKGIGIREGGIQLQRALEELQCRLRVLHEKSMY